jgi:hypothetical protein
MPPFVFPDYNIEEAMTIPSQDSQRRFRNLLDRSGITQTRAADLIAEQTGRPCSVRSVRAWLAPADRPSARPCPEWSVTALDRAIAALKAAPPVLQRRRAAA